MPKNQKVERNLWKQAEIETLLKIIDQYNVVNFIREKKYRSEQIFRFVQNEMITRGFKKKNHQQIWTKWKFLKSSYVTTRRHNNIPGNNFKKCDYYDILDRILGNISEIKEATAYKGNRISNKNNDKTEIINNSDITDTNTNLSVTCSEVSSQPQMSEDNENELQTVVIIKQEPFETDNEEMLEPKENSIQLPKLQLISEMKLKQNNNQQNRSIEVNQQKDTYNKIISPSLERRSLPAIQTRQSSVSSSVSFMLPSSSSLSPTKRKKLKLLTKSEIYRNCNLNTDKSTESLPPPSPSPSSSSFKKRSKHKDKYLHAIKYLGNDLRKIQKNFIKDYFEKQQELMRKEHEFQRRQDELFLKNFEIQTNVLLENIKNILSTTNVSPDFVYINDD